MVKPNSNKRSPSWRQSSSSKPVQTHDNSASKWGLVLLLVLLVGAFAWYLWPRKRMTTYFVTIQTGDSHQLAAPFLPSKSFEEFVTENDYHNTTRYLAAEDLSRLWEFDSQAPDGDVNKIRSELGRLSATQQDALIVYVAAHGVGNLSSAGSADLLCRDFSLTQKTFAAMPVQTLMEDIATSPAGTKLLILDSGGIVCDKRLGVIVNEFNQLVLEQTRDPSLWVLVSNGILQESIALPNSRQTLFANKVYEGLSGKADQPKSGSSPDGFVTMGELYSFVLSECATLSNGHVTPWLLHNQEIYPLEKVPSDIKLVRLSGQIENPASKALEDAPANTTAEATDASNKEAMAVASNPTSDVSQSEPSASNHVAQSVLSQLNEAWKIRDEIHRLADSNANATVWLPSDFAPHLWRSYNQLLVDMERRIRFGSPSVVSSVEKILQRDLQDLKTLRSSIESTDATDSQARPESVLQMLLDATFDFHTHRQSSSLTVSEFNSSLQVFNQASLLTSELVRWHGLRPSAEAAEVETLVAVLADHHQLLKSLNHQSIDSQTQELLTARTGQLVRTLNAAMDPVHREVTDILANPHDPTSRVRMESLLATWLPIAQQRFDLLNALDRLPMPAAVPNKLTVVTNEISAAQKSHVLRQIKLEQQLVQLFSNHPSNDNSGFVANDFWKYARTESQAIRQAYESLLQPGTNKSDTRFAYFLDGRDAFGTEQKLQPLSMWDIRQHLLFATMDSHEINVAVEQDRDVSIEFQLSNPENRSLNLQFEPAPSAIPKLAIQYAADTSGRFSPVPTDGAVQIPMINGRSTLKLKIKASQFDESDQPEPQSTISVHAAVGSPYNRVTESLTCILPKANRIDLIVNQVGTDTPIRPRTDLSTRLRPFPNRATAFDFFLENRSGQEKTVNVQLLQVPKTPNAAWPPGLLLDTAERPIRSIRNRLFFEDGYLTRPDIQVVAKAESLVLPANGERKKIVFANASPPADKTDASAAPGDGTNGPSPPAAVDHDVSYGLVCLVSNASDASEFWPKWIELSVLHPSSYVDAAAVFNSANRQLNVTVRATKDAPLPINVVWHTSDLANSVQQDQRNVIESAAAPVRFSQTLSKESSASTDISLDIDGYPRAIIQQIELVSGAESQPVRNRHAIRVKSVEVTDSSTQGQPQRIQVQTLQRPSLFRLDQLPATMRVQLEIDSPADSFATSAGRDKIEIALSPSDFDSQRVSYYSDRNVATYLKAPAATGSLVMETVVTDVVAELNPSSTNVQAQLEAQLTINGRNEDTFVHTVIFDGDNPIGKVSPARKIFDIGKPLDFAWTASDRSGISKAEFLLATSKTKAFPDEVEATVEVDDSSNRIRQKYQLATDELNVPEGTQREFWLRARFSDRVGHQFESQESVTIRSPRATSTSGDGQAESQQEVKGTLTVLVQMASGATPVRPKAIIKDRDDLVPVPMGDGVFAFQDLPAGEYEIEASGIAGGQQKTGSKKVVLKTLSDYGKKIVVNIK